MFPASAFFRLIPSGWRWRHDTEITSRYQCIHALAKLTCHTVRPSCGLAPVLSKDASTQMHDFWTDSNKSWHFPQKMMILNNEESRLWCSTSFSSVNFLTLCSSRESNSFLRLCVETSLSSISVTEWIFIVTVPLCKCIPSECTVYCFSFLFNNESRNVNQALIPALITCID